jgi:hypothetical protein
VRSRACAFSVLGAALLIVVVAGCTTARAPRSQSTTLPLSSSSSPSAPVSPVSTGTHWIIASSAVSKLEGITSPATVANYLDGSQTTVLTSSTIPSDISGWHVTFALDTRSLAEIQNGVDGLTSRISEILYDPEHWSYTPLTEQLNVGAATRQAASLAHAAGRQLIVAPATNLAQAAVPGASAASSFIQTDDLAKVAASANMVEIQAQGLERNTSRYAAYIAQAVSQIRSANASATIYAGLSTNPSGGPVTTAELISAVQATSSEVTGYWLNIPSPGTACPACGEPQPQLALDLLEQLAQ